MPFVNVPQWPQRPALRWCSCVVVCCLTKDFVDEWDIRLVPKVHWDPFITLPAQLCLFLAFKFWPTTQDLRRFWVRFQTVDVFRAANVSFTTVVMAVLGDMVMKIYLKSQVCEHTCQEIEVFYIFLYMSNGLSELWCYGKSTIVGWKEKRARTKLCCPLEHVSVGKVMGRDQPQIIGSMQRVSPNSSHEKKKGQVRAKERGLPVICGEGNTRLRGRGEKCAPAWPASFLFFIFLLSGAILVSSMDKVC